jgi:scyllo-inositol 2-dehydrogenase (NADP+)
LKAAQNPDGLRDPFGYFARVVRGQIKMSPGDLSSPENNLVVVRILDAARQSAKTGKTVVWKDYYKPD